MAKPPKIVKNLLFLTFLISKSYQLALNILCKKCKFIQQSRCKHFGLHRLC
jgi:hypothetical protein